MSEFIKDNDEYTELGELHSEQNKAVIGRIDSRYENNRKHSLLPVDSSRIIQNFSSNVTIKDSAIIPREGTFGEKQIYIGNNFLAIYDRNTGNFISENPRSYFKSIGTELGIKDIDEYHMLCDNIKNVVVIGKQFFVFTTRAYDIPVIICIDPYNNKMYTVNGPDEVLFNMIFNNDPSLPKYTIIGKPFCFDSETIGIICRKEVDNSEKFNVSILKFNVSKYVAGVVGDDTSGIEGYLKEIKFTKSSDIKNLEGSSNVFSFYKDNVVYLIQEQTQDSSTNIGFGYSLNIDSGEIAMTKRSNGFLTNIKTLTICTNDLDNRYFVVVSDEGVFAFDSLLFGDGIININDDKYRLYSPSNESGNCLYTFTPGYESNYMFLIYSSGNIYKVSPNSSNLLNGLISSKLDFERITSNINTINISGVMYSENTIIVFGTYKENETSGSVKPFIKEYDINEVNSILVNSSKSGNLYFLSGIESETYVSKLTGKSFGKTKMSRVHIIPQLSSDDEVELYIKEDETNLENKFTSGKILWNALKESGIPFNTHVKTIGRIIIDGIDVPIENVMITRKDSEENDECGSVLLTFDKNFDLNVLQEFTSENAKIKYPGILFRNNTGFIEDAMISNVYSVDGGFCYNDQENGKLFGSSLDKTNVVKTEIYTTKTNKKILIVATGKKIASIDVSTGSYTNCEGTDIGDSENTPKIYFNTNIDENEVIEDIEVFNDTLYIFTSYLNVYTINLKTYTLSNIITSYYTYDTVEVNQKHNPTRIGNTVFFANVGFSNTNYNYQTIIAFDLEENSFIHENDTNNVDFSLTRLTARISQKIKFGDDVYFGVSMGSEIHLYKLDLRTRRFSKEHIFSLDSNITSFDISSNYVSKIYLTAKNTTNYICIPYDIYTNTEENRIEINNAFTGEILATTVLNNSLFVVYGNLSKFNVKLRNLDTNINWETVSENLNVSTSNTVSISPIQIYDGNILKLLFVICKTDTALFAQGISISVSDNTVSAINNENVIKVEGETGQTNSNFIILDGDTLVSYNPSSNSNDKFNFIYCEGSNVYFLYHDSSINSTKVFSFDTRTETKCEVTPFFLSVSSTIEKKFVSAFNFTYNNQVLVVSYDDGSIASWKLSGTKTYYPSNYRDSAYKFIAKHVIRITTNSTLVGGTIKVGELYNKSRKDLITWFETNVTNFKTTNPYLYDEDGNFRSDLNLLMFAYNSASTVVDDVEVDIKDLRAKPSSDPISPNGVYYAVFTDQNERYVGRSRSCVYANAGEFLNDGAVSIDRVNNDLIFRTPTNSVIWAEDIGCFFKGSNEKYTGMKENEKGSLPKNPICEAGIASYGKYVFYVNGYDIAEQTNPWKTVHTGVSVLNTETGEIATLFDGKDLLYGTLEARVKPFCVYKNGYLYVLCGFARYNDRVMGQNIAGLRRSDAIEVIDLDTCTTTYIGSFEKHSKTFDPTSDESPTQADLNETFFFNEIEENLYVARLGDSIQSFNTLTGKTEAIVSHGNNNGVDTESNVYIPFGKTSSSKYLNMYNDSTGINIRIPTNTPTILKYTEQENPIITNPCKINGKYIFSIITTNKDETLNRLSYSYDGDNELKLIENTNLENRTISKNSLSKYPSRKYSKIDNNFAVCDDLYNTDQGKFSYLHEFVRIDNKSIIDKNLSLGFGFVKELYKNNTKYIVSFVNKKLTLTRTSEVKDTSTSIDTTSSSTIIEAFFTDSSTVTILQIDGTTVHIFNVDTTSMMIEKRKFTKLVNIVSNVIFANGKIHFLFKESKKIYHATLENIGNNDSSENVILNSWEFVTIEESDIYDISINNNLLNVCGYKNGKVTIAKYSIDSTSLANGFERKFSISGIVLPYKFDWLKLLSDGNIILRSSNTEYYSFSFVNNFVKNGKNVVIPKSEVYKLCNFDHESISYYINNGEGIYNIVNIKSFMYTINQSNEVKNITTYSDDDTVCLSAGKLLTAISKNTEVFIYNKNKRNISNVDIGEKITSTCVCCNNVVVFTENKNIFNISETNITKIENAFTNIFATSGRCSTGCIYYFDNNILYKFKVDKSSIEFVNTFDDINGDIISIKEMEDETVRFLTKSNISSTTKLFNVYEYFIPNEETKLVSTFTKENIEGDEQFIDFNGNIVIPKTFNASFTSEKFFTVVNGCDKSIEYSKTYSSDDESSNFLKIATSNDEIEKLFVSNGKLYLCEELYKPYSWGYSEFTFNNNIFNSAKLTHYASSYFTYKVSGDNISIFSKETKQLVSYIETQGQINNIIGVKVFVNGLLYVIGYNGTNLQRCVYSLKSKQLVGQIKVCDTTVSLTNAYCDFIGKYVIVFNGDGSKAIIFDFIKMKIKQISSSLNTKKIFGYYNGNILESDSNHAGCVIKNGKQALLCDDTGYYIGETCLSKTEYSEISTTEENVTVIPSSNNKVLVSSNVTDTPYKVFKMNPTFSNRFELNNHYITIFSGTTTDTIICEDRNGTIVDTLEIEREYGCYAKNVSKYNDTKCFITYSEGVFISTLYVSEDGKLTLKRYDGTLFGKLLNIDNNVHTIQEVDFTLLFDEAESELGI